MGQELHDSAGQLVVALQLSVAHLRQVEAREGSGHDDLLQDIQDIVRRIDREIRAVAFLQYPFELRGNRLCSAVQKLTLGFGERTGIRTSFTCVGDEPPVNDSVSVAILRVAQEALVNIHRHSRASSADVALERRPDQLHLTVSDDGIGMASGVSFRPAEGIGLQGMRHRIEVLGGTFEIKKLRRGMKVSATVPIAA